MIKENRFLHFANNSKDGLLFLSFFSYLLGYTVWAIYAYKNRLGLLPVWDFQYFIAGAVPLLLLGGLVIIFKSIAHLQQLVKTNLTRESYGWKFKLRRAIFNITVISFALTMVCFTILHFGGRKLYLISTLFNYALYSLIMSLCFFPEIKGSTLFRGYKIISTISLWIILVSLVYGCFLVYLRDFYPNLPQELGGAKPRCGYLDLIRSQLSSELSQEIFPLKNNALSEIMRTKKICVLFACNDYIMIKIDDKHKKNPCIYELKRSIIQGIEWNQ